MFKGKKILFFSISFFGYQSEIKNKLIELGAEVDYYDERPKNTFWYKFLIRLNKNLVKNRIEKYYNNIIKKTQTKDYDYVFFIKGEVITPKILKKIKDQQPKAKYILYLWDSIEHRQSVQKVFPLFDKILSFDLVDANKNSLLKFRPLFYLDTYADISQLQNKNTNDLIFIGTAHPDRYPVLMKARDFCKINNLKSYFFIYLQDWRIFYLWKLFSKSFSKARMNEFEFKPLNKNQIILIIESASCVLDVEKSNQSGLTMRTLEVLGSRRKLITTNQSIKSYDFYNEHNILIINRKNPVISKEFIKNQYQEIDQEIYKKYSLEYWLKEVFE
ncbi:hypothetical protein RM697_05385 [Ichthyenterobacterium sp. W332]|uniref:Capsular biosynthesis protein CpsH n=1 Tax=Microcosmobacter mediterraneus TaxID=3075607 RepID=A0ABU2YIR4_9FLAO|nr:hypothetical protein [Ichthyenterobacterium sp. W332]MDT0558066.1 hypothetical protein [Ichthyenterobacterium sp. W332]